MAKPRSRRGGASEEKGEPGESEEARVFRAAVRDVTPLPAAADLPQGAALPRPPVRARARRRAPDVQPESLGDVVATEDAPGAAEPLSSRRPGVREQTLRHLKRGRYPVEDELDLHGLSQAAARDYLVE